MCADNVFLAADDAGEGGDVDEFAEGALADVEDAEDAGAAGAACEGADFEETLFFVGGVDAYRFADYGRAEDDGFVLGGASRHGVYEVDVVFAGFVGEVNGATGNAAACGVETGIGVRGLEHVPVWEDVEVGCQEGIVGIYENVPRMRGRNSREEVVAISDHHTRLVEGKLSMEEYLRELGHAGNGFNAEVAEGIDGPGVLEGGDVAGTVGGI